MPAVETVSNPSATLAGITAELDPKTRSSTLDGFANVKYDE